MRDCRMSAVADTCDERCGKGFGVGLAAEIASTDPVDVEGLVNRLAQPCGFVVQFQVIEHHRRGEQQRDRIGDAFRSEEHTSELQSLMRISYAVFCLTKKNHKKLLVM